MEKKKGVLPENAALDPADQKKFVKKVKKMKKKKEETFGTGKPGVCYVGHIPRGFHEKQMKKYFSQFGIVKRLKISRSIKTGEPKGYAFVEFENDGVAEVVASTMNNYLMFHRLLKCQFIPEEKVHPETFKGCERKFKRPKGSGMAVGRHNKPKTEKQININVRRMKANKSKKLSKLADLGIDYEYPNVVTIKGQPGDQSALSDTLDEGKSILYDDSSEEEVSFTTPPNSVRKNLDKSVVDDEDSDNDMPKPKRRKSQHKLDTPKSSLDLNTSKTKKKSPKQLQELKKMNRKSKTPKQNKLAKK